MSPDLLVGLLVGGTLGPLLVIMLVLGVIEAGQDGRAYVARHARFAKHAKPTRWAALRALLA